MNCTHPDHEEGKSCLDRAVACHRGCECCLGELVQCGHCRNGEHEKCLQKRKIVSSKVYGECPCNHIAHESIDYLFKRLGEKFNQMAMNGQGSYSAIILDREDAERITTRIGKRHHVHKAALNALNKITGRAKGEYTITLTLEV